MAAKEDTRSGLTRAEFHELYADGTHETARKVDALWRAADTAHRGIPTIAMLGGVLLVSLPAIKWVATEWPDGSLAGFSLPIFVAYFAGIALVFRSAFADGVSAGEQIIKARLEFDAPLPDAWIPEVPTHRNWLWRSHVLSVEHMLIETGQLSQEQLGPDPEAYAVKVDQLTKHMFSMRPRQLRRAEPAASEGS